jgi:thiol-disulfide isomerase/thioredoxin
MRIRVPIVLPGLLCLFAWTATAGLVEDVRDAIAHNDFAAADRLAKAFQRKSGDTPELAVAVSWLARGELAAKNLDQADAYATQARTLALKNLHGRKLDQNPFLVTALGASIEVHAQVLHARAQTSEAIAFLKGELQTYGTTSLVERIQKNINLISLEGKPAPALESAVWFGPQPPTLASLKGKAVLLFFWAHWCPDCKQEVAIIANLLKKYGPRGLVVIGPTRYYGYVANGDDATPAVEKPYIQQIRERYYSQLSQMPVPLSNANFARYGASSTPTLALIDRQGIVRYYHPGAASEAELSSRILAVLK